MKALKFVLYVIIAVLGSAGASLLSPGGLHGAALFNVLVLALTAAVVYWKGNTPTQPWAKTLVAVFGAGVTVLVSAWSDGHIDSTEIVQIILAMLGVVQVGAANNVLPGAQTTVVSDPETTESVF